MNQDPDAEIPLPPSPLWSTDSGLLEGGPLHGRVFSIDCTPTVVPPLHVIFTISQQRVVYKRLMVGVYPSRNDQGQLRYAFQATS